MVDTSVDGKVYSIDREDSQCNSRFLSLHSVKKHLALTVESKVLGANQRFLSDKDSHDLGCPP